MNGEPGTATVLGLGAMGSALARALLDAGHLVTAWNRTPARGASLGNAGACLRADAAEAIADSDIVIACVSDYAATGAFLHSPAAAAALRGRLLVQLTSGIPREARALEIWARAQGADYLDGAILAYPSGIGAPECTILYSGAAAAWERGRPVLAALGANAIWLGPDAGAAAALDAAFLAFYYGATLAWLHGAAICESEGLPVEGYLDAMLPVLPVITETLRTATAMIARGDYAGQQCTLAVHAAAMGHVRRVSAENGAGRELAEVVERLVADTVALGRAGDELPAVFERLRPPRRA